MRLTPGQEGLRSLWKKTQMIFQDPYSTFNPLASVYDSLAIPVRKFKLVKTQRRSGDVSRRPWSR